MPWPISPAPPTKTLSIAIGSEPSGSATATGHDRVARPISSSAAENGSRRCSATAASSLARAAPVALGEEPRPQPVADDRPDLRLGPGEAGGPARLVVRGRSAPVEGGQQLRDAVAGRGGREQHLRPLGARTLRPTTRRPRRPPERPTSIARSWAAVRCAPGRSPLFTTTMSATSSRPALIAWTSSPISGASRTTVVSAAAATSTSLWPVPTVSTRTSVEPDRVEQRGRGAGRRGETAGVAARGHRADEDVGVLGVGLHPDPVAEQRAAGDRRRRVDRDDGDGAGTPRAAPR